MRAWIHGCAVAALAAAALAAQTAQPAHVRDVPFVPTTPEAVDAMLKLADVQKSDVVYDLGCGDGRIVIAAAKNYGARGVGIDIDPGLVRQAKANAAKAGVVDLVRFEENDLFQADIHDATVVTLFLLPTVNLKLRPKLLGELKPGTRIVSNTFNMGDWKPRKQIEVGSPEDGSHLSHVLYLWVVPATP